MMRVNIYYGGRGLIEDPTIYVMNKLTEVLSELNIEVKKYNLYEDKRGISVLPKTLKEADGVILAASVEWLGIGGLLQQFLDACWLYGDKDKLQTLYMMPVVTSVTIGEQDALSTLIKAWEILGGIPTEGICAYVSDYADFETNPHYATLIEKKGEQFYRTFSRKIKGFPTSTNAVYENIMPPKTLQLTPQESEQLSMYVSDVNYVQKQKEDIEELTHMFQGLLGKEEEKPVSSPVSDTSAGEQDAFISALTSHFNPTPGQKLSFSIYFTDLNKTLLLQVQNEQLTCSYTESPIADVMARMHSRIMKQIIAGTTTYQNAFLAGSITAKGEFRLLHAFDELFTFGKK